MKRLITGTTSISSFRCRAKGIFSFYGVALFVVAGLLFTLIAGCENPIEKGGDEVIKAMERSQAVADSATVSTINNAAQSYRSMNGKYPENIEELEHFTGETIDREKFEYDPATGKLSTKN